MQLCSRFNKGERLHANDTILLWLPRRMFVSSQKIIGPFSFSLKLILPLRPFNSQSSLEEAKRNVESQFSVVGVIEDLNTTLAVLEKYIPRFFAGARELYFQNTEAFKKVNKNNFKIDVSEEVKNIVRQNFTREIKFYEFCKKRLQAQLLAVTTEDL